MEVFSYSRLKAYEDCPAAFYRRYVLNLPEAASPDALYGRAGHAVIKAAGEAGGLDHVSAALAAVCALAEVDEGELARLLDHKCVREAVEKGGWFESHFELPLDEFPLAPSVQGYIDYFREEPDCIILNDWKFGHKVYHPLETHQMGIYAYYLAQRFEKPVRARLVFLRAGRTMEYVYSEVDIEAARSWALETAYEIQSRLERLDPGTPYEAFPPRHGSLCAYCTFSSECADGSVPEVPETLEQAQQLGAKILHLEGCLEAMKERLKAFVEVNGPVPVDGKQFNFAESVTWKWGKEALSRAYSALLEAGADPFEVFTITSAGLKKAPWRDADLLELGAKKSVSKRFVCGKG